MRQRICVLSAIAIACVTGGVYAQQLNLTIEKAVWTDSVDRVDRSYGRVYESPITRRKIQLWTQIRGTRDLLDQMRGDAEGSVRIRHVWKRYASNSVTTELDQPLDVGRKADLWKLSYEVDALGFFSWRVWSEKMYLTPGYWSVDVVWDTDEPVVCIDAKGDEQACTYNLEVR